MPGVITRREVIRHPILIVKLYGPRVLWRALTSHKTFLQIVMEA